MLRSLTRSNRYLKGVLLRNIKASTRPINYLLVNRVLRVTRTRGHTNKFLRLPHCLLHLLRRTLILLVLNARVVPNNLCRHLRVNLFRLLILRPIRTNVSRKYMRPTPPYFRLRKKRLIPHLLRGVSRGIANLITISRGKRNVARRSEVRFRR